MFPARHETRRARMIAMPSIRPALKVVACLLLVTAPASPAPTAENGDAPAHPRPPSCDDARFRAFDFWVGTWDVLLPDGRRAGTNTIERVLDGCLLVETWRPERGGGGRSISFFDRQDGRWHQVWVDAHGLVIRFVGARDGAAMRFEGRGLSPRGEPARYRMSFTPQDDGSVLQEIDISTDGGTSWKRWFTGRYVRH
ncbi:MAG: DUF1579 domain-containing protein [Acidobacteria bacterium]|nr:MAG: DUF1579 domain-containing protein [Acidobacteriota bacterium]